MSLNTAELLEQVIQVAEAAGTAILEIYADQQQWDVQEKSDQSPLTAADLAAHRVIKSALMQLTPDIPVLSEESENEEFVGRRNWALCWVVDPLDGTKEFLKRNGDFTVNIALVENTRAILGVVHVPDRKVSYFGGVGLGAKKRVAGFDMVLKVRDIPEAVTIVASRHHRDERGSDLLKAIEQEFGPYELVNIGSALKTCLIAEGSADCYPRFGPTMEWDTAAAQIILEEAGGFVYSPAGEALTYNCRDSLINGSFIAVGTEPKRWLSCWPK